jgi:hypothetical protein
MQFESPSDQVTIHMFFRWSMIIITLRALIIKYAGYGMISISYLPTEYRARAGRAELTHAGHRKRRSTFH